MQNDVQQKIFLIVLMVLVVYGIFWTINADSLSANADMEKYVLDEAVMVNPSDKSKQEENSTKYDENKLAVASDTRDLGVNTLLYLSGKSKQDIYKMRKRAVETSLFATPNYQPSEEVFGGIESGKPWSSAEPCNEKTGGAVRITGFSEESRFINNPNMLVAVEYPFTWNNQPQSWCEDKNNQLVPTSIKYSKSKNEIIVTYYAIPFMAPVGNKWFYTLNGLNARDLGYKYAYIDNSKSTYKPHFTDSNNITNSVIEFQNYIHVGGSCGHSGGCNNGSPRQSFLEFQDNFTDYNYKNREMYIKLWKNRPNSPKDPADIVERIVFTWS